jgi:RNA polymerase sigma-70 factor (ECF subfamily)
MEAIFLRFHARLVFYASEITGNEEQAQDIVLTSFMDLWEGREKLAFNGEKPLQSYLYTCARNAAINYLKRSQTEQKALRGYKAIHDGFERPEDRDALILKTEAVARLSSAIEALPAQYKLTVEMALAGKSNEEIADALGIKESTVRSNMARAKSLLLKRFTGDLGVTLLILSLGTAVYT